MATTIFTGSALKLARDYGDGPQGEQACFARARGDAGAMGPNRNPGRIGLESPTGFRTMRACRSGDFEATEHARDFINAFRITQAANPRAGRFIAGKLLYLTMLMRLRGDLWQMGHA